MAEGYMRDWEWIEFKRRRRRGGPTPGGLGIAQGQAAAAGYSSVEEWEAAGWPHPIDPDTGSPYEGYKIDRMERGRHPTGRKMTDEDWFDPKTQQIFDYLSGARVYSKHYQWAEEMRAKYPNYPMPGVNIQELLRQMFPEQYGEKQAPPLPTVETLETMMPPGMQKWMARMGLSTTQPRVPPTAPGLPGRLVEPIEEGRPPELQRWMALARASKRPEEPALEGWPEYMEAEEKKPTTWREYLRARRGEVAPEERPAWERVEQVGETVAETVRRIWESAPVRGVRGVLWEPGSPGSSRPRMRMKGLWASWISGFRLNGGLAHPNLRRPWNGGLRPRPRRKDESTKRRLWMLSWVTWMSPRESL